MWNYEKRLQYPVKITQTNPKIAQIILTQFGGPDGELAASMRYLAQRYTMPYKEVTGILTDIGTEESVQKWYQLVSYYIGRYSFLYQSICSRIQYCCQPHQHLCIQNSIFFSVILHTPFHHILQQSIQMESASRYHCRSSYIPSKILHVFCPTMPSIVSPCTFCNVFTAFSVPDPKIPSMEPQLYPRLFNLS